MLKINMKAKAGYILLLIGMMCFTGFGNTTADLDQNSTTEAFQGDDLKVSTVDLVIVAPLVFQDLHVRCDKASNKYTAAAKVAARKTDLYFATRCQDIFLKVEMLNPQTQIKQRDVGWYSQANENDLPHTINYILNLPDPVPRQADYKDNLFLS